GAVILPGYDFDMPPEAWAALDEPLEAEDHPQARFRRLLRALDAGPEAVRPWHGTAAPVPARARLVSVALRPAPVTDRWMDEGPGLRDLGRATDAMALIEAPGPRAEALAVALRMRRAVDEGRTVALITPDRVLSRQVTAALDRWGILPDDSGGRPLALSAPGRFLRQVAALRHRAVTIEALLGLLKHPLCHSGAGRGPHLLHTRELELHLRRHGPAFPDAAALAAWAARHEAAGRADWAAWLAGVLADLPAPAEGAADHVAAIRALAERLAAGAGTAGAGALWDEAAGVAAAAAIEALQAEAPHAGPLDAADAAALLDSVLAAAPAVREAALPHPAVLIWGTLEARVQGAEVVILAGLNDGIWPPLPAPDPWLNRRMRAEAGLRLPERQVGLSAHDFQQAVNAPEVVLSRALRDAESETVPSRWLNRLVNLMGGLKPQGGPEALAAMRAAGRRWLELAAALEADWQP
ncbi:MAG: double-strand break repair protein AddB, partial [Rhodobacteraceae bacterium]|nr:double-strand break repair protein AddB [Paracoccaceae bacterium]